MKDHTQLASDDELNLAVSSCKNNGMHALIADDRNEARDTVLNMVPKNSEVFTMTSVTLDTTGISEAINASGNYISVREKLNQLDPAVQKKEMRRLGAAPDWAIGSVHAATEEGHLLIASNTGSQLAAEVYGAEKVIFVVGAQKIVKNDSEGLQRIHEYVFPLEDARAMKAYGINSFVSKLLTINREVVPKRITVVFVRERLGF
jgi:L-lactate utilization protein LutB